MNSGKFYYGSNFLHRLILVFLSASFCFILPGCTSGKENSVLRYEVVSDTLVQTMTPQQEEKAKWEEKYTQCMQRPIFSNAIYLGLQENIHIGSISNLQETNVHGQFSLFDTSLHGNIRQYFTLVDQVTCNSKFELTPELRKEFHSELVSTLRNATPFGYLTEEIDTSQMDFRITTLADNALHPDSLITLLQETRDSSLTAFKRILATPGNALLVRTAMILGFYTEFPLNRNLSAKEEEAFKKEVIFKIGNGDNNGSIRLVPGRRIQVFINKYYTVFGQFYTFSEDDPKAD